MTLDFRQRLLATTLFVGASLIATPALAQDATTLPPPEDSVSPPDNSATPSTPETTAPLEGTSTPSTSATGETVEEPQDIVVTGSRIPQPNLESASPVTVVTAQEVKLSGTTRTEDLINSLPQSFAAQGSNVTNGATGTATVNLRGLGSARTLVLVNGRRLMPGDPTSPVPDINFIPSALIKRVDVLTGGASSVYGADAVAGVVNFIMDTNFRGLRIDAQGSGFMHNNDADDEILSANEARGFRPPHGNSFNGEAMDIAASFGAGFDDGRGSVMAYATYRKQRSVLESTRDYSYCNVAAAAAGGFTCGGSGTSALGTFLTNVGNFTVGPDRTFVPSTATTNPPFNFAPYNYFQRPDERYTLGAFADYEISDAAKPYLEAMFMDDHSDALIAPSGDFFNTASVNCDNPLLSAQQRDLICQGAVFDPTDANAAGIDPDVGYASNFGNLVGQTPIFGVDPDGPGGPLLAPITGFTNPTQFNDSLGNSFNRAILYPGRRNVEGGGRDDDLRHTAYRIVAGVRGDLARGLSYDAYYQYGTSILSEKYSNDFSVNRLNRALDVIAIDTDNDGVADTNVCRSAAEGTDANCVPYDIFSIGGVNPDALSYLQTPGFSSGNTREQIANVNFTILGGEYGVHMPWTDRGISANVGAEYRKEALDFDADLSFRTGDLAGQGAPTLPVSGSFDVRDLFAEVEVPIINDSFFYELTVRGGYRYSNYKVADNSFNTDTYKIEAEFAPIRDVRLRGSYNRAVRAPNVVELFAAQRVALAGGSSDPCAGVIDTDPLTDSPTATLAQCQLTGVSATQFGNVPSNPAAQYSSQIGGNPNLQPETADTYTAGLVLQPRFIPGLAVTVDYFNIKLKDAISTIGFDTILDQCIQSGDPFYCDRINRDARGSLYVTPQGFIVDTNTNVGGISTKGVDVQASYARQIGGMGSLNLSLVGTYLDELITDVGVGGVKYDCKGFFGTQCGTPNPEWRHKLRVGFAMPNGLGISGQWRYFSSVDIDASSDDPDLASGGSQLYPKNLKIDSQSYFDLALTARLADRYNFRIGANNIFDKEPPIAGSQVVTGAFGNGNTYPQVYDSLGRYVFAGVTVDF